MGNGSSQTIEGHRRPGDAWASSTLPRDMALRTPNMKRLPGLGEAATSGAGARLRSTDNGAILFSGGTISGRRASGGACTLPPPQLPERKPRRVTNELLLNGHMGVYRSRSVSSPEPIPAPDTDIVDRVTRTAGPSRRERDPLHRSHGLVDQIGIDDNFGHQPKKFGSEPNLRGAEDLGKSKMTKHFRKKYRAPQPPSQMDRDGSSPDSLSWKDGKTPNQPHPPSRKLRLFKTRAESKKQLQYDINSNGVPFGSTVEVNDYKFTENMTESSCYSSPERRNRTPSREKNSFIPVPISKTNDMVQSRNSLHKEKMLLQSNLTNVDKGGSRPGQGAAKTKVNRQNAIASESRFIPNITKAFRHSERFKKETAPPANILRREKSFDSSLMESKEKDDVDGVFKTNINRKQIIEPKKLEKRLNERLSRNSMPLLGTSADDFQKELMMATNKIRNQFNRLSNDGPKKVEQTSQSTKLMMNGTRDNNVVVSSNKFNNVHKQRESSRSGAKESASQIKNRNIQNAVREKLQNKTNDKNISYNLKTLDIKRESRTIADRGQASGKESTPEQSPSRVKAEEKPWDRNKQNQPSKQFYFGMDKEKEMISSLETPKFPGIGKPTLNYEERQTTDKKFSDVNGIDAGIKKFAVKNENNGSSESALSSEPEIDDRNSDEMNPHGIDLKLRPTLPKKQPEMPRFSPAAAWRQLAALEAEQTDRIGVNSVSEDCDSSRLRSGHDKSGDSGISGDVPHDAGHDDRLDSPGGHDFNSSPTRQCLPTWTPQQDLEEESSSDQGVDSPSNPQSDNTPAKFSARNAIFSLSLPRENQYQSQAEKNKQQSFNSLQKLRKSVSGAFGALGSRKPEAEDETEEQADRNWFLSRSAPNSLNNGLQYNHRRLTAVKSNDSGNHQTPPSSDQEEEKERVPPVIPSILRQQPQFSYLSTGGHVMYLPEYDSKLAHRQNGPSSIEQPYSFSHPGQYKDKGFFATLDRLTEREDSFDNLDLRNNHAPTVHREERLIRAKSSGEIELKNRKSMVHTISCENLASEMIETGGRKDLQAIHRKQDLMNKPTQRAKGKRFTFQSTVRQIERRRLAEKLSREAEQKERQRLTELEAMRRVEEEFQRKRAREKASIRQQLRLVTGSANGQENSDLPLHWDDQQPRMEPEGAAVVTSVIDSSPADRQSPYVSRLAAMRSAKTPSANTNELQIPRKARAVLGTRASDSGSDASSRREQALHQPAATKVLSEYKVAAEQPARQYRDYTSRLSGSSSGGGTPPANGSPPAVQHPPACYNMPRSTHVYVSAPPQGSGGVSPTTADNYRLQFARGAAASSSGSGSEASGSRGPPRQREPTHHMVHQPPAIATVSNRLRW